MRRFVVLREGEDHESATDVLVVEDVRVAADVVRLIARRFGERPTRPAVVPLKMPPGEGER